MLLWTSHYWDGILARARGNEDQFLLYRKDFVPAFDYYSPVIIANNDYLGKSHKEGSKENSFKR